MLIKAKTICFASIFKILAKKSFTRRVMFMGNNYNRNTDDTMLVMLNYSHFSIAMTA